MLLYSTLLQKHESVISRGRSKDLNKIKRYIMFLVGKGKYRKEVVLSLYMNLMYFFLGILCVSYVKDKSQSKKEKSHVGVFVCVYVFKFYIL